MKPSRTLEQLEGEVWPAEPEGASPMVRRCHALRKVQVAQLSAGDLRVLIGQDIGTKHLVPIAIGILEGNPLIEGDHYPGDLLTNLIRLEDAYWIKKREEKQKLYDIAKRAREELAQRDHLNGSDAKLLKDINGFLVQPDA